MGAAQLDTNIEEQLIFRRFVAVSAYNLFRRVFPNSPESRVFTCNIAQFLVLTGLPTTDADIDKYGSIIRRGQRQMLICRKLKDDDPSSYSPQDNLISDDTSESMQDSDDYGLLFFSSIPDAL
ncbi:hypothetical protein N7526_011448 [Penicillium atrosanguineum]|nr:hypothetical protein N7526_011448 [Penicillium atrosanguineum]